MSGRRTVSEIDPDRRVLPHIDPELTTKLTAQRVRLLVAGREDPGYDDVIA